MTKLLPSLHLSLALLTISLPAAATIPSAAAAAQQMTRESHVMAPMPAVAVLAAAPATSEQVWQLRSSLNVAALMCGDRAMISGYNWLLRAHAPLLARTWSAEQQRFQKLHGSQWQTAQDRQLTSLYNRLANTNDRGRFCADAHTIISEARMVPTDLFAHFAASAINRLLQQNTLHLAAR
ncbi:hypothetical protein [Sandarakinorhabdus sp.]|uniref:hypothetical protein n=1 Tax=Sandarakinorhabdus sp. TaxID=1916663 RepID=UPI00286DFF01|nr:hypothetical protein [Sandarakinorhabdus sp.]